MIVYPKHKGKCVSTDPFVSRCNIRFRTRLHDKDILISDRAVYRHMNSRSLPNYPLWGRNGVCTYFDTLFSVAKFAESHLTKLCAQPLDNPPTQLGMR